MDSDNEAALLVLMERTGYPMLQVGHLLQSRIAKVVYNNNNQQVQSESSTACLSLIHI